VCGVVKIIARAIDLEKGIRYPPPDSQHFPPPIDHRTRCVLTHRPRKRRRGDRSSMSAGAHVDAWTPSHYSLLERGFSKHPCSCPFYCHRTCSEVTLWDLRCLWRVHRNFTVNYLSLSLQAFLLGHLVFLPYFLLVADGREAT
jgi:hypothetical protein